MNIRRPALLFSSLFAVAAMLLLMATLATRAEANTYCVDVPGPTGCVENQSNFQLALDHAAQNAGPDIVKLGAVTVKQPDASTVGFQYSETGVASGGNSVTIVGAGVGQTTIKLFTPDTNNVPVTKTVMELSGYPGSKISDVTIDISNNEGTQTDTGLQLGNGNLASNVAVIGQSSSNVAGVKCLGCTFSDSSVNIPEFGDGNVGFLGYAGDSLIKNSTISSGVGVKQNDPNGTATIENSRILAFQGATTDGGAFNIQDSLIKLTPGASSARGVVLSSCCNQPGPATLNIEADLDGVTIIGDGTATGTSGVYADSTKAHTAATLTMANTLIAGTEHSLDLRTSLGNSVTATTTYSAYKEADVATDNGLSGIVNYSTSIPSQHNIDLNTDPLFYDQSTDNYTPLPGSVLSDKGDPAAPAVGVTDIFGHRRDCNSIPGGIFRRDIGAFEYNDCTLPNTLIQNGPAATTTDRTPAFTVASSKPFSSYECTFDSGNPVICNETFDAPDLGLGDHTLSVTATDEYGNRDLTPATASYKVVEPSCQTDSSLCPTCQTDTTLCPDKTAPKVSILGKVPKKTSKASLKIKFKSNESGSTFTCQINKAKARKCKSPYKAKLKKGKKNLISIVATDKAGNRSKAKVLKVKRK